MKIIGLTGSIGMGKSTVAQMFKDAGAAVCDSDAIVHAMYAKGGAAVDPVAAVFPEVVVDGAVDRTRLGQIVLKDAAAIMRLEQIVHPIVKAEQAAFLDKARARGSSLAVLDIPLLFEGGGDANVDLVVVVSAPADVQRERVLARTGMSEAKFDAILARQTPDEEKRRRADVVIDTGVSLPETKAQVDALVARLRKLD